MINFSKISKYIKISGVEEIVRRYFAMNGFDGILTILGVIIGMHMSNLHNPSLIILTSLSTSVAVGISGFSGTYMTEKAERIKKIKKLERAMLTKLKKTIVEEAAKFAYFYAAFVAGISPLIFSTAILTPFLLTSFNFSDYFTSFYVSLGIAFTLLFLLGVYLGKISEENIIIWGLKMFLIGLITSFLISLIGLTFK